MTSYASLKNRYLIMKMKKSISRIPISINQILLMNPKASTMNRSTMEQTILSFISGLWTRNMSNLSLKVLVILIHNFVLGLGS